MKKVKVTYFKPSGKYYTKEIEEISEELSGYHALFEELPKRHRIKDMFMLVQNVDDNDGVEPYIVPHLFHPLDGDSE